MTDTRAATGTMIYGIVPADVEPTDTALGVGDPPAPIDTVAVGEVAALVSDVPLDRPLGRPADLSAYQELLDRTAAVAPVVPIRFGTVVQDPGAIRDMLRDQAEHIVPMLERLEGRVQFMIRGRYVEDTILAEILRDVPEAAQLREEIRGRSPEETTQARMRLGELINGAIEQLRERDMQIAAERLRPVTEELLPREPSHELDAVYLAALVRQDRRAELDDELEALAGEWDGRVTLRRLGPLAAYDFVAQLTPEG